MISRLIARALRVPGTRSLWKRFPLGQVETRVRFDVWDRPHYAYGVWSAAQLAKSLKLPGISVFELGVAGGRGLLALEAIAKRIASDLDLHIDVYGFDIGSGMPEPLDYRDVPYVWRKGFYKMDVSRIQQQRLTSAKIIIGDVAATLPSWTGQAGVLPLGFVAFDMDFYSSTATSFCLFDGPFSSRLPRVLCYFDDIRWPEYAYHNEFVGELLAIREFNERNEKQKLCPIHLLRNVRMIPAPWNGQMYVLHDFLHPGYCALVTPENDMYAQLPI
jgi:hypothetical protein